MKQPNKRLLYLIGLTAFLIFSFNINYGIVKNILFGFGIFSAYAWTLAVTKKKKGKSYIPSYIR